MEPKELLSLLVSIEDDLTIEYHKFCIGNIKHKTYQKRKRKIIQKQIDLINQFKKETLLEFLYWWVPEIHAQDAHSQINKFEEQLTKQK